MSTDPNSLLFVISARGNMTWQQYREAVDYLSPTGISEAKRRGGMASRSGLLQCLEALGHCDAHYERGASTISVTPPALCRLPRAGLPVAVLTGARCFRTLEEMSAAAEAGGGKIRLTVDRQPGPIGLLPDTIQVSATSEETMAEYCAALGIRYAVIPPAWSLMHWTGMLSDYEATLDFRIPETLNWARYDFSVVTHEFTRETLKGCPRFSRYRNPTTNLPTHVFFRDGLGAEVGLNWGRYLLLNAKGITVTAYDERQFRLCVPVKVPL
ncbi:MAG TPA: hypothetical protein PK036_16780, partial [Geobacteraceae bacterium]|nr:hypothetical protein [Geobacteraceae bacterium]